MASSSADYIRNRRSPTVLPHPAAGRKALTVDVLSGKKLGTKVNLRPAHQGDSPCSGCENFQDHGRFLGACSKVAGSIQMTDACDLHQPSQGSTQGVSTAQEGENHA